VSTDLTVRTGPPAPWRELSAHALRAFFRNPLAAFFTLAFPVLFLVIVGTIVGGERTPEGVPIAQFLVAPFAVFGIAQATFTVLAVDMVVLRESGVLLRLRAAPVPAATVLAARIAASSVAALLSLLLVSGVGVAFFGVEIVWGKVPALLLTLVTGVACLSALGVALASLSRTVTAAQTLAQGLLIPLAFISDVFIVGADLPRALDVAGSILPLKHFARATAETFHPGAGYGLSPGHLAVLVLWTALGATVAVRRFGWAPTGTATAPPPGPAGISGAPPRLSAPRRPGRPPIAALLAGQVGHALRAARRDPLSLFFTVAFPLLMLLVFPAVFGDAPVHGRSMAQYLFAGMATYAMAVAGFVNLPESVAGARAAGVLKRLRGTPLPYPLLFVGQVAAALLVGLLSVVLLTVVAVTTRDVRPAVGQLSAVALIAVLGGVCFAVLGLAVVALLPSVRSAVAVTLGLLLPLCFVSEVFVVGGTALPGWLSGVGGALPLRPLMVAMLAATRPEGAVVSWSHLGLVAAWTVAGATVVWLRRDALTGR
jgi:ABC-type transport system involved in cytochrome c biogenesis permease component